MTTRPVTKADTTAKPSGAQRKTRQRAAVEEILSDRHDFRTAQQIHDDLRHHGERIGLTTVYRTLQLMTDAGDLDAIRTNEGETAYRRCSTGHHHHLVCRTCGSDGRGLRPRSRALGQRGGRAARLPRDQSRPRDLRHLQHLWRSSRTATPVLSTGQMHHDRGESPAVCQHLIG